MIDFTNMNKPFTFFLFGVTGNLAQIKVIPAIYDLFAHGDIPAGSQVIGVARKGMSQSEFEKYVLDILHLPNRHHTHAIDDAVWQRMRQGLSYISGDFSSPDLYTTISDRLRADSIHDKIFYLATYPQLYESIFENLKKADLNTERDGFTRLMLEKPIGIDLESASRLAGSTLPTLYRTSECSENCFSSPHIVSAAALSLTGCTVLTNASGK